ncbi:MAG TPA: hypothetical protein VF941_02175 [Clostridia bacterium]
MISKNELHPEGKYRISGIGYEMFQKGEIVVFKGKSNALFTFSQGNVEVSIGESKIEEFLVKLDLESI